MAYSSTQYPLLTLLIACSLGAMAGVVSADAGELNGKTSIRRTNSCAAYGPGFVSVDGADTCVKVGGHVRVEFGNGAARGNTGWDVGSSASAYAPGFGDPRSNATAAPMGGVTRLRAGHSAGLANPFGR